MAGETSQCEKVLENGQRCRAPPLKGDRFCLNHSPDPKVVERLAASRRKGGRMSRKADGLASWEDKPISTMEDLKTALSVLFNAGAAGDISTARLSALASIGNALTKVIEQSDLERRIEELESKIKETRK